MATVALQLQGRGSGTLCRLSLGQFKRCLKTILFESWDYGALWLFVKQRRIEIVLLTYLRKLFHRKNCKNMHASVVCVDCATINEYKDVDFLSLQFLV